MKFIILTIIVFNLSVAKDGPWHQDLSDMDKDGIVFMGQSKSTIDWENLDESWLDFQKWKKDRVFKDANPLWKIKLRNNTTREKIAALIKCVGQCMLYSTSRPKPITYNSGLFEGDEIATGDDSVAWVLLLNGSLLRLSPNTTVALNEINLKEKSTLTYIRINEGHVYFESRKNGAFKTLNLPETDQIFLPLEEMNANREFFSMYEYRKLSEQKRILYEAEKNAGAITQYKALNEMVAQEDNYINNSTHLTFINSPAYTLKIKSGNFNFFYRPNSTSYIKYRNSNYNFLSSSLSHTPKINLRDKPDYANLEEGSYEVSSSADSLSESSKTFRFSDLNIKRIPSIHLARELMLRRKFPFMFAKKVDQEVLAKKYGYKLWTVEDSKKRFAFLEDSLFYREKKSIELLKKYVKSKEVSLEDAFFKNSSYIKAKKEEYKSTLAYKKVREFSDLQYFVWIMQNAK